MPVKAAQRLYGAFCILQEDDVTTPRRRIEEAPFTEVLTRVAFRVVQLEARKPSAGWRAHPPTFVYALAEQLRAEGFVNLYWTLNQAARWLAHGYTMRSWRDELRPDQQMRAFHKQRGRSH